MTSAAFEVEKIISRGDFAAMATVRKNEQKNDGNNKTTNKNNQCTYFHLIFSVSVHNSCV